MSKGYEKLRQGKETDIVDESGNPRELKLKPLTPKTPFSKDGFASWYESYEKLQNAKTSLGQYGEIVLGRKTMFKGMEASQAEGTRRSISQVYQGSLIDFSRARAKDLSDLVWDTTPKALAGLVLATPTFEGEGKYEETRKAYEEARGELNALQENPDKYLDKRMEKLDDLTKAIFAHLRPKMAQEEGAILHDKAIKAVDEYGFPKFVQDNLNAGWKASEKEIKGLKINVGEGEEEREATFDEKRALLLREGKGIEAEVVRPLSLELPKLYFAAYQAKKKAEEEAKKKAEAEAGQQRAAA